MSTWRYQLRSCWSTFSTTPLMSVVSIGSIGLAMWVLGGVILIHQNVMSLLDRVQSQASMVAYLQKGVSESTVQNLRKTMMKDRRIVQIDHKNKQEAMADFRRRLGSDADLLEGLQSNPLPASLQLHLRPDALSEMEQLAGKIREMNGVESVQYGQEWIERLRRTSEVVEVVLGVLGLIIAVVAVFIIFNTSQLSVVARRTEIDILKLVGATRGFIAFPFVLGGFIQGLIGSALGLGLLGGMFWLVQSRVSSIPFLPPDFTFLGVTRISILLALGAGLGGVASAAAVYRNLRDM